MKTPDEHFFSIFFPFSLFYPFLLLLFVLEHTDHPDHLFVFFATSPATSRHDDGLNMIIIDFFSLTNRSSIDAL